MIGPMRLPLINWMAPPADAPRAYAPLYHPACVTCVQTGMTCKNG
jgi:hypothetical protein